MWIKFLHMYMVEDNLSLVNFRVTRDFIEKLKYMQFYS